MSSILVIEKDRAVRLLLEEFFRGRGNTVFSPSSTEEALESSGAVEDRPGCHRSPDHRVGE